MNDIVIAVLVSIGIAIAGVFLMTISGLTRRNRRKRLQAERHDAGMI